MASTTVRGAMSPQFLTPAGCAPHTLPIGTLLVLADVVVVIEVEVHFLPTLRWPSVFSLKFLRRLWPILVRVDGRGLITAVHVETDGVQDLLIGHLRNAG